MTHRDGRGLGLIAGLMLCATGVLVWVAVTAPITSPSISSGAGAGLAAWPTIVVQVHLSTPPPTATATPSPTPYPTSTPTDGGYPICDRGMPAGTVCVQFRDVPITETPYPACSWTRAGLCVIPEAADVAAKQEVE